MTHPELGDWPASDPAFRRSEVSSVVGTGAEVWDRVSRDVLLWKVKTESGFRVRTDHPVAPGERLDITFRLLLFTIVEPVRVVAVVREPDRVGFSYRTLPGHPVAGEESFVVARSDDIVTLTIRSLTRPAPQQPWRMLFPLLQVAQRIVRARYLRSLGTG